MSTHFRRRRPAVRPGATAPRLRLESLEPRCACAVFAVSPAFASSSDPTMPTVSGRPTPSAAPAVVTGIMSSLTFTAGVPFAGAVLHLDAPPPVWNAGQADNLVARIDWGNGQQTTGVVQAVADGSIVVVGANTYAAPGNYPVVVQVAAPDGSSVAAAGMAKVEPAPLVPVPPPNPNGVPAVPPVPFEGQTNVEPPRGTPAAVTPTPPARPPLDTSGAVMWLRRPDPRPAAAVGAAPASVRDVRAAQPVTPAGPVLSLPHGGADEPATEVPVGPAYLASAADPPVEFHGAPAAEAVPINMRPGPIAGDNVAAAVIVAPVAALGSTDPVAVIDVTPPATQCVAAMTAEVVSVNDSNRPRQGGLWWKSLTWCAALIVTERALAARGAERLPPRLGDRPRSDNAG